MKIDNYIKNNKDHFLKDLFKFLKIKSISAQSEFKKEIRNAALFLKQEFKSIGMDKVEILSTKKHPIVYAEKIISKKLPTILVYGHYDVQPPEPLNLWFKPPFEPYIKNNKIYARGAADDKGQVFMHIKAIETLIKTNNIKFNVKFIIEGEEEMGSDSLSNFLSKKNNLKLLNADVVLVSDTEMISLKNPSIPISLRGIAAMDIEIIGPNRDLHSGVYGGAVANPIEILCKMFSSLKDENNHIKIPHFYDDVIILKDKEKDNIKKIPFNIVNYKKEIEVKELYGEKGYNTIERTGIRPSIEINGIWGGYTEKEGFKTVLPTKAFGKLSLRLVANQNAKKIAEDCKKYLLNIAPKSVDVKIKIHDGISNGMLIDTNSKAFVAAQKAIQKVFKKEPILTRGGGSIPILSKFQEKFKIPIVMLGFGLPSDNIHSPNENFGIDNFFIGLNTIIEFYKNFSNSN
ncbi:MAG: dipeptidase [Bacteroidetes bacterium]|nr:dipeptidase [Bacteroidota bacterium]